MAKRPENLHERYHAHVYFDESTEDQARALCIDAWRNCHVGLGRFHRRPVGPHPDGAASSPSTRTSSID